MDLGRLVRPFLWEDGGTLSSRIPVTLQNDVSLVGGVERHAFSDGGSIDCDTAMIVRVKRHFDFNLARRQAVYVKPGPVKTRDLGAVGVQMGVTFAGNMGSARSFRRENEIGGHDMKVPTGDRVFRDVDHQGGCRAFCLDGLGMVVLGVVLARAMISRVVVPIQGDAICGSDHEADAAPEDEADNQ